MKYVAENIVRYKARSLLFVVYILGNDELLSL